MHTQQETNSNQDDAKTNFLPVVVDACDQVAAASRHSFEDCVPTFEHEHVVLLERATPSDVRARVQQVMTHTSAPVDRQHDFRLCQNGLELNVDHVQRSN